MSLLLLLACGGDHPLQPSLAVGEDPAFSSLPADVTLVGGGDIAAAMASPLGMALAARGLLDVEAVAEGAAELGVSGWGGVVAGCGSGGCVGVAEGEVEAEKLSLAAEARGFELAREGERQVVRAGGVPFAVQACCGLAEPRAKNVLFGDMPAVLAFGGTRVPADAFLDVVPAGDLWLAARDADRLLDQAAIRLRAEGSPAGEEIALMLEDPERARNTDLARAVGFSVQTGETSAFTLRVSCIDTGSARKVAWMLELALVEAKLTTPETLSAMLDTAEIYRNGDVVEARMTGTPEAWALAFTTQDVDL